MSDDTYEGILSTSWDNIKEPDLLPTGTYKLRTIGCYYKPGNEKLGPNLRFLYSAVAAGDDVDPDVLEDLNLAGAKAVPSELFFVSTDRDLAKIKKHLGKHTTFKMPDGDPVETLSSGAMSKALKGTFINGHVGRRTYNDRDGKLQEDHQVTHFSAVED